jgi:ABC-2 type transport system permease protein
MGKYRQVMAVGMQNTLVYRVNFLFRATFGLVPLFATIQLWRTVFASRDETGAIAGYRLEDMISYYLVVTVVDALTAVAEDDWQIAAEIREGTISQFLIRPIDHLKYRLCLFWSGRVVYTAVALLPVGLFIFFQREHLVFPGSASTWGWFLLSLALTGLLQFLISYTMALLAFWFLEISTFIFMLFAFEYIAGGHLFPLDVLPPALAQALHWTPFPYQLYFPVNVFLGKAEGAALLQGLCMQLFWILVFYAAARWIWSRGIRRYTAFGG